MTVTGDIDRVAAAALRTPPARSETLDVLGPRYTERDVALHTSVPRSDESSRLPPFIPQTGSVPALTGAGLPTAAAELLAELLGADQQGLLAPRGDRTVEGTTPLESTLADLVSVRA